MLELRPLLISRVSNASPGALLVGLATKLAADDGPDAYHLAASLVFLGVVSAVRGYRMGITVKADTVTVRGLTRSRTISRSSFIGITGFPALRWQSESGRTRWTPITAFPLTGRNPGYVHSHNAACLDQVSRALMRNPGRPI